MADQVWRMFRDWPMWVQILSWLLFFWLLLPLLIWRTSWSTAWKAIATVIFVLVVGAAALDDNTITGAPTSDESASEPQEETKPDSSPTPDDDHREQEQGREREDDAPEDEADGESSANQANGRIFLVARVVDGDTVEVQAGARVLDVRLIGVDTPETVHPSEPVQCFGPKASDFTTNQLEGKRVRLELDVERRDRYGRTLAYVWLGNRLFNETLVARGYGQVATYPPNVKYVDRFIGAQRAARNNERGLWKACRGDGRDAGESENGGASASGGGDNCDPNYKGACIPPYPPDLNCDDVSATGFRSVGNDPHGFDGDGDGIACE